MSYPLPKTFQETLASSSGQRFVVMTCGIAGAGKSTFSHTLCTTYPNFIRLSIDKYIFTHHGLAGMDCPIPQYAQYQAEAKEALKEQFRELLREGIRDVVLDFSFSKRAFRDEWRSLVSEETGSLANENRDGKEDDGEGRKVKVKVVLMFFDAEEEVLWRRIKERRMKAEKEGRGADDAMVVTRAMLDRFVRGFERPEEDEKMVLIKVV